MSGISFSYGGTDSFTVQPPERLTVDDAVAIALERGSHIVFGLGAEPAAGIGALGRFRRVSRTARVN